MCLICHNDSPSRMVNKCHSVEYFNTLYTVINKEGRKSVDQTQVPAQETFSKNSEAFASKIRIESE